MRVFLLFLSLSLGLACDPAICSTQYNPVCGSDGRTYSNLCELNAAHRCNETIVLKHEGECTPSCPTACTEEYQPVCGTNGVTYGNRCMLDVARCEAGNSFDYLQDGPCPNSCPGGTPTECLVDPCQGQTCPKYPSAQCYAVYCNGCNYEFRTKEGQVVTDCELPEVPCNGPGVRCLVQPCSVQSCPAYPDATCQDDYCTGCNTRWYWEGEEVSCLASCAVSFWLNRNPNNWPIDATSRFNTVFNVPYHTTLQSALRSRSTGRQQKLGVQAVAALLNAESFFGFKYSPTQIKDQVRGAWNNAASEQRLLRTLTQANSEGHCPL